MEFGMMVASVQDWDVRG